jgi:hypothetical protein
MRILKTLVIALAVLSAPQFSHALHLRFSGFKSPIYQVIPWSSKGSSEPFIASLANGPGHMWNEFGQPIVAFDAENQNYRLSSGNEAGLWQQGTPVDGGKEYLLNLDGSGFIWSLRIYSDCVSLFKNGRPATEKVELLEDLGRGNNKIVVKMSSDDPRTCGN